MKILVTSASITGCVRENNEDIILVNDKFIRNGEYSATIDASFRDRLLIALADGMGGHNCGEIASSDTLHSLHYYFNDIPAGLQAAGFDEKMVDWLESINNIIKSKGIVEPRYKDMGTTLVALAYYEHDFYWINCGDSRLYRLRDGVLTQLTTDHSLNNMLGSSEHSSIITNCIGGGCDGSYLDIIQFTDDVRPGDSYMLCSDGLTDMISDRQIESLLSKQATATDLCNAAVDAGGFDNVSVCIAKIAEIK